MRRIETYVRIIRETNVGILQALQVHSKPRPYLKIVRVASEGGKNFSDENAKEKMFPERRELVKRLNS
jgi:hypothetical protein